METFCFITKSYWSGWIAYFHESSKNTSEIYTHPSCLMVSTENVLINGSTSSTNEISEGTLCREKQEGLVTTLVVPLNLKTKLRDLATGVAHVVFVTECYQVYTFGYNSYCQLGKESKEIFFTETPLKITDDVCSEKTFVKKVAAGPYQTFVLSSTSQSSSSKHEPVETLVYSFGRNEWGQLGHGISTIHPQLPSRVLLPKHVEIRDVVPGAYHTLALTIDGSVLGWGSNKEGQLGGCAPNFLSNPTPFMLNLTFHSSKPLSICNATASMWHSFFVSRDHEVFQLGLACVPSPLPSALLKNYETEPNSFSFGWEELITSENESETEKESQDSTSKDMGATELMRVPMFKRDTCYVVECIATNSLVHCAIRKSLFSDTSYQAIYWSEHCQPCYVLNITDPFPTRFQGILQGQSPITSLHNKDYLKPPRTVIWRSCGSQAVQCCVGKQALIIVL